jgi:hypothetical protein
MPNDNIGIQVSGRLSKSSVSPGSPQNKRRSAFRVPKHFTPWQSFCYFVGYVPQLMPGNRIKEKVYL